MDYSTVAKPEQQPDIHHLIKVLESGSYIESWQATYLLGNLKDVRAVEPLIRALRHPYVRVRYGAAQALGRLGDLRAVEPLIAIMLEEREGLEETDETALVRPNAAEALGRLGDTRAIVPLIQALKYRQGNTSAYATNALVSLGKSAVPSLIEVLTGEEDYYVREGIIKALGQIGDTRALDILVKALLDPTPMIPYYAAIALGEIKDRRAVEPLISILSGIEAGVRWRVALALGHIGDERAIQPLVAALSDRNNLVAYSAAKALAEIGGEKVMAALQKTLNEGDESAREYVLYALRLLIDKQA